MGLPEIHRASREVLQAWTERLKPILCLYPEIAALYLFGSVARDEARSDSDIDLGIVFKRRGDTALDHHRRMGDLASRLEAVSDGRPIDLVVLESQGPLFRHRVLLEGGLVHEGDRGRRIDFESETYSRAFDFRPTYELATRGRIAAIRRRLLPVPAAGDSACSPGSDDARSGARWETS